MTTADLADDRLQRSQVSRLAVRIVPASAPVCGIALAAAPALTAPHTITVLLRGSMRRDSTPGRPVISVPIPYTRSAVRCGRDVCPPGECRMISIESAAEVIGPGRPRPCRPPSRGSQCRAKIRDTPVSTPAAIASIAPPGISSSAGWKISRTATGSSGTDANASAAPSSIAVWPSWPHACATLGTVDAYGSAGPLGHRQRVHVGAQRDPRQVLRPEIARQPGAAGQHLRVEPGVGQLRRDELGGGELLAAQLRVAVDVPAPPDQLVVVGGQP